MTNTYAINTTRGKEFEVEKELEALGLKPWVARRLDSKYIKEKREAVWFDVPYVPKLIFCTFPAIYWPDVVAIKHVIGKPLGLSRRDVHGVPAHVVKGSDRVVPAIYGLADFQRAVALEYGDMQSRKLNSEFQCRYEPGQALEILSGAFAGFPAEFTGAVKRAHDEYAKLRVSVQIFGRDTPVELDPDKVRQVS